MPGNWFMLLKLRIKSRGTRNLLKHGYARIESGGRGYAFLALRCTRRGMAAGHFFRQYSVMVDHRIVILLGVCLATSCSSIAPSAVRLIGYGTVCYGQVKISAPEGNPSAPVTQLVLPAGEERILVVAENETQQFEDWPTDAGALCYYHSTHLVKFHAQPGKIYRLHLDQETRSSFSISVHEGLDDWAVDTRPVAASSEQLNIEKRCGFLGGGWCEKWSGQ